jgi:hypothetical protein
VLLSSGHSRRSTTHLLTFAFGAIFAGTLTYAAIGAIGALLPVLGEQAGAGTLLAGSLVAGAWHVYPQTRWLRHPRKQLRRDVVLKPKAGAAIFGAVLGIGWLTAIATPFVWVGLLACFASGSPLWGAAYGFGFGFGRSLQLFESSLHRSADNPTEVVLRTVFYRARLTRLIAIAGSFLVVAGTARGLAP